MNFSYQNGNNSVNLTGSPDFPARVRVVGDPGGGCSSDIYRQFNVTAFLGPLTGTTAAGFGAVTGAEALRAVQAQIRFQF